MSICDRLLRARFNPCADRVEAVGKQIDGLLDSAAEADLMAHLETCPRCRGYRLFLEAADRGFRGDEKTLSVVPALTAELPIRLQEEMVESLKRNLAKWLVDLGRAIMYRDELVSPFFFDGHQGHSLDMALKRSMSLSYSLQTFNPLSKEDELGIIESIFFLRKVERLSLVESFELVGELFIKARNFLRAYPLAYLYHAEILSLRGSISSCNQVLEEGLHTVSSSSVRMHFLNYIGRNFFFKKELNKSKKWFRKAGEESEGNDYPIPALNSALCCLNQSDAEGAVRHYNIALNICENISEIHKRNEYQRYFCRHLACHLDNHKDLLRENEELRALSIRFGSVIP